MFKLLFVVLFVMTVFVQTQLSSGSYGLLGIALLCLFAIPLAAVIDRRLS